MRGYDTSGEYISKKVAYEPTLFLPSKDNSSGWKTMFGEDLTPVKYSSVEEMQEATKTLQYYYGLSKNGELKYAYINDVIPGEVEYKRSLIKEMIFDIETESEGGFADTWENPFQPINAITAWEKSIGYITWGLRKSYTGDLDKDCEYRRFDTEIEMLHDFFKYVRNEKPDIISGWNIDGFDIPYIINRATVLKKREWTKLLSPWDQFPNLNSEFNKDNKYYRIPGITILDYMDLYKKFNFSSRESYSLNSIANIELGEEKLDYSEFESLQGLYKNDWNKFIEYNIRDVYLVRKLDEKLKYFDLAIIYAYLAKVNFEDIFGSVKYWDIKIYNHLYQKKIACPTKPPTPDGGDFAGGYVKEVNRGMHKWVASFDLNSLYPSIMVQFNISPETVIDDSMSYGDYSQEIVDRVFDNNDLLEKNVTMTANGCYFKKDKQGFVPEIIENLYDLRKDYKNKMIQYEKDLQKISGKKEKEALKDKIAQYSSTQNALKLALNSLYGAFGNRYFRYFDGRLAEGITLSGQAIVKWCENTTNKYMNSILKTNKDYVIGIDTDSVFVCMEDLIDKFCPDQSDTRKIIRIMDQISEEKIVPEMNKGFDEIFNYLNCFKPRMVIKRESLANIGIWIVKKKYVMNVYNNEGVEYTEPKLKIRGIEIVRSSTPAICREAIRKGVKVIFEDGEDSIRTYIKEFKKEFINSNPNDIAFPRGVNDLDKWVVNGDPKSGMPIHVRGAYNYNTQIDKLGLNKKFTKIGDGEKIKFLYLKSPNPIHSHVIGFPSLFPKEFHLEDYIDYETQFEKAFLSPIKIIMDAINWEIEKKVDLLSLF